jgi:hypothetical protein
MRGLASLCGIVAFCGFCTGAEAVDFSFQGYADFLFVMPERDTNPGKGGLGKLQFGGGRPEFQFAQAVGQGVFSPTDDLHVVAVARFDPRARDGIDALETYIAYRPSMDDWHGSLKAGVFFPPFSLENVDLGWSSPYTQTSSAINSWFGDELRTIGTEVRVERRTAAGAFALTASVFCCNDPAGVLIAYRGWTLDSYPTGVFEKVREPDATVKLFGETTPGYTPLFREIDNRAGWYAGLSWSQPAFGKAEIYRYDNEADPSAVRGDNNAWRTRFWSAGWETFAGPFAILAQGLTGDTTVEPVPGFYAETKFRSAYVLVSYDIGDWRLAGRAETFQTRIATPPSLLDEDGTALTAALSWRPRDWLRMTAEVVEIDSKRNERLLESLDPNQSGTQFLLGVRLST